MVPVSLRPMQWWLDLMARGGVAMWPLAVISVGAVALLLERAWAYRRGAEVFLRRVEDATPRLRAERAQADIERFLPTLSTVITAAPLIGILGTVLGLIDSFAVIGAGGGVSGMGGGAVDLRAVGGGIAEALLSTAAGLAVALGVLLPYTALRARAGRLVRRVAILSEAEAALEGTA